MRIQSNYLGAGGKARGVLGLRVAAAFAASPRRLRSAYLGPAMRVRRSSDNAEADIGFDAAGNLDTFALMRHVSAENQVISSEDIPGGGWARINLSVTADALIAPDGSLTGDKVVEQVSNADHRAYTSTFAVTAGQVVTASIYAKSTSGNRRLAIIMAYAAVPSGNGAMFNVEAGTFIISGANVLGAAITPAGGGWFRCSCTFTIATTTPSNAVLYNLSPDAANLLPTYQGDGVSGMGLWGAQLNTGPVARDYCRTTSAPTVDGSGFVTTMYDQSGNGRNLTQATAANQPRIVNAGVVDRMSSGTARPMMRTDGVSQKMATGAFSVAQPFTRSGAIELLNVAAAGYQDILTSAGNAPNTTLYLNAGVIGMYAGTNQALKTGAVTGDALTSVEIYNGAGSVGSINGAALNVSPGSAGISGVQIGAGIDGPCSIKYSDIIIFPSALSTATRLTLEANQKTYYGTP